MGMIATGTEITKPMSPGADNYMFRLSMTDREQVVGLLAYAKKAGVRRIGVIVETTGYGLGSLKDLDEVAKLQGIEIVSSERMAVTDTDVSSQLSKMKATGVDTIVVWTQGTPMGQVMRSMEKVNWFPRVLASWAADNITFFDAAGKTLAEKVTFMRPMVEPATAGQKALFERLKAKLPAPSAFTHAAQGYDAVMVVAAAIRQAGTTDGNKVRLALEDLKTPAKGVRKVYEHPFTATNHEAFGAQDSFFVKWSPEGRLVQVNDAVTAALTPADFKR